MEAGGISKEDWQLILNLFKKHAEIKTAVLFGSRAKGNYKTNSDVDIALTGKNGNLKSVSQISSYLNEETNMPYQFDILNTSEISNDNLLEHIKRVGIVVYSRK